VRESTMLEPANKEEEDKVKFGGYQDSLKQT